MDLEIAVSARDVYGKQNKRLRTTGVVPGVLFGKSTGSIAVQLDGKALEALYRQAGRTSVVKVSVDGGQPTSAIIKSLQRNPLTGKALHVDLFAVDLTQEMLADIPLSFTGTSSAWRTTARSSSPRSTTSRSAASPATCRTRSRSTSPRSSTSSPQSTSATWWSTRR